MEKVVVKTAVKTVLIIIAIFIVAFAVFNLAFPHHMATLTEKMGNYSLAVRYADLSYSYAKDPDVRYERLVRCFEDSVLAEKDSYVVKYGDKLLEDKDEFEELLEDKQKTYPDMSISYGNWVYSNISASYYNLSVKEKSEEKRDKAFEIAIDGTESDSFVYGNPLMSLAARIYSEKDEESAKIMLQVLEEGKGMPGEKVIAPTDEKQCDYLDTVIRNMKSTGK